jgi:hypothetical protein
VSEEERRAEDGAGVAKVDWATYNDGLFAELEELQAAQARATADGDDETAERHAASAEDLRTTIFNANEGLALRLAARYGTKDRQAFDRDELVAHAREGLWKAITTYVRDKGAFGSWAALAIHRELSNGLRMLDHPEVTEHDFKVRRPVLGVQDRWENNERRFGADELELIRSAARSLPPSATAVPFVSAPEYAGRATSDLLTALDDDPEAGWELIVRLLRPGRTLRHE